ncbi:hypothetical protein K3495_g11476 [Podosphaera aphanis]|nr:hypothetical protein K3495_g11476 [Podosphaera aphanis]
MLGRLRYPEKIEYKSEDFDRQEISPDISWYSYPRFVQHVDDKAESILTDYYAQKIKSEHNVVDIGSSWVSHLPKDLKLNSLVGYGLNKEELERNPHLTEYYVKDLNSTPSLEEIENESVDIVLCSLCIDYLTQPIPLFQEMRRILKPGGKVHIVFNDRYFPTKVFRKWVQMDNPQRRRWIGGYFWASGDWVDVEEVLLIDDSNLVPKVSSHGISPPDSLFVVRGTKPSNDFQEANIFYSDGDLTPTR